MNIGEKTVNAAALVAVACAVLSTGLLVRRELFLPQSGSAEPVNVANWEKYLAGGRIVGDTLAPVKVLEFSDYQCPYCKRFTLESWPVVQKRYPAEVALVIRHWPLRQHKHAYAAARAAECAASQGVFESFHKTAFEQQDSIGVKPWASFAQEAGVRDATAFAACVSQTQTVSHIEADIDAARKIGANGTPALIIAGVRYPAPPDTAELLVLIEKALKAKRAKLNAAK